MSTDQIKHNFQRLTLIFGEADACLKVQDVLTTMCDCKIKTPGQTVTSLIKTIKKQDLSSQQYIQHLMIMLAELKENRRAGKGSKRKQNELSCNKAHSKNVGQMVQKKPKKHVAVAAGGSSDECKSNCSDDDTFQNRLDKTLAIRGKTQNGSLERKIKRLLDSIEEEEQMPSQYDTVEDRLNEQLTYRGEVCDGSFENKVKRLLDSLDQEDSEHEETMLPHDAYDVFAVKSHEDLHQNASSISRQ